MERKELLLERVVVRQLKKFTDSSRTTPGMTGTRAFLDQVMGRTDFFHPSVQRTIDIYRGNRTQREYLTSLPYVMQTYYRFL